MRGIVSAAIGFAAAMFASAAIAQQPVDWDKVQIKTTDLGHNTYMLAGMGGNITVAVGSDAIVMVDGQYAPLHDKIKAAITAISPLPIKYLINTHFHGDHTGGNGPFQADGVTVVAQDNIRVRLTAVRRTASLAPRRHRLRRARCRRKPMSAAPATSKLVAA